MVDLPERLEVAPGVFKPTGECYAADWGAAAEVEHRKVAMMTESAALTGSIADMLAAAGGSLLLTGPLSGLNRRCVNNDLYEGSTFVEIEADLRNVREMHAAVTAITRASRGSEDDG